MGLLLVPSFLPARVLHSLAKTTRRPYIVRYYLKIVLPLFPNYSMSIMLKQCSTSYLLRLCQTSLSASPASKRPKGQKTTKLDRKMPQPESRQPSLVQSSRATVLELWASPDLLRPPGTQLDSSWSHQETNTPDYQNYQKWGYQGGHFLPIIKLS